MLVYTLRTYKIAIDLVNVIKMHCMIISRDEFFTTGFGIKIK